MMQKFLLEYDQKTVLRKNFEHICKWSELSQRNFNAEQCEALDICRNNAEDEYCKPMQAKRWREFFEGNRYGNFSK